MFKYLFVILPVLFLTPAAQAGERNHGVSQSSYSLTGGRFFAISGCFRSWRRARVRANRIGGHVINTSNWGNLRSGYKCAVRGTSPRWRAYSNCSKLRNRGYACYVKAGY